jgi:tyrosinase
MAGQVLQDTWETYLLPLLIRCSSCTTGKYTFLGQLGMQLITITCSNIDRLFAIWQALNPDKWMDNIPADNATIRDSFGKEHIVNGNTPLQPFRRDAEGNYWTPEGVRFTPNLGYSYPELPRWETKYHQQDGTLDQVLFKENITTIINGLYGVSRDLALDPKAPTPEGVEAIDGGLKIPDFAFSVRFLKYVALEKYLR